MGWIILLAAIAALVYTLRLIWRSIDDRRRASEERAASLLAQVAPPAPPAREAPIPQTRVDAQERLLLEAAGKAAQAGEPALAIQLYARLLARYPDSSYGAQARSAVEEQKRKLAQA